jgi:hypothetical protein
MERLADAVNLMNAQLEHRMVTDGRPRLKQIRDKTYELNSLLWAALHTDDDGTARRDLEWATRISLEVTRELLEYAGGDKRAIAEWVSATPRSPADQG